MRAVFVGGVLLVVFVLMAIEAVRAAENERRQRDRGGWEPPGDVYDTMRIAYPAAFLAMAGEAIARGADGGLPAWWMAGAAVFVLGKAIKWWAIATLGDCWTFRVIVVPGSRRVRHGPYRWLQHPNYVGVIGELVGVALLVGAPIAGPLVTAGFALLIGRRLRVERQALGKLY